MLSWLLLTVVAGALMFDMKSSATAGGVCFEVMLNMPIPEAVLWSSLQSWDSEARSEHCVTLHEPASLACIFTASWDKAVPATCVHDDEFEVIWFEGVLKPHMTRAYLAASDGFLTVAAICTTLPTRESGGNANETNDMLSPRTTLKVLPALNEWVCAADAQLVDALTVHNVTFHVPTSSASIDIA